jgi:hypothetical protein
MYVTLSPFLLLLGHELTNADALVAEPKIDSIFACIADCVVAGRANGPRELRGHQDQRTTDSVHLR